MSFSCCRSKPEKYVLRGEKRKLLERTPLFLSNSQFVSSRKDEGNIQIQNVPRTLCMTCFFRGLRYDVFGGVFFFDREGEAFVSQRESPPIQMFLDASPRLAPDAGR